MKILFLCPANTIQHPAHIEYIGQFDTQSNSH